MTSNISRLLERASSADSVVQDEAILQLAMLLEFNRLRPEFRQQKQAYYAETVPSAALVSLDEAEERGVVRALAELVGSERFKPSILWAIGKAKPWIGCAVLLSLISTWGHQFDSEATWQATAALDNLLLVTDEHVRESLKKNSPTAFLERAKASGDERVTGLADRILRRVQTEGL